MFGILYLFDNLPKSTSRSKIFGKGTWRPRRQPHRTTLLPKWWESSPGTQRFCPSTYATEMLCLSV